MKRTKRKEEEKETQRVNIHKSIKHSIIATEILS